MSDSRVRALFRRVNLLRSREALAELDVALCRQDGGPWLPEVHGEWEERLDCVRMLFRAARRMWSGEPAIFVLPRVPRYSLAKWLDDCVHAAWAHHSRGGP